MTEATETLWSQYATANESNPAQRHRWRLILQESRLGNVQDGVVVDLGCGSGALLAQVGAASPKARLVGLDIEPRALAIARNRLPNADFFEADLDSGQSAATTAISGKANLVLCSETLEHLTRPEAALTLARTILAPGGRIVVTVPSGPMTAFDRLIGHQRHYTIPMLSGLLTQAGFTMNRIYRWGFPFHSFFRIAVGACPGTVQQYSDGRISTASRVLFEALYRLFFLNIRSSAVGRQIVAVARLRGHE